MIARIKNHIPEILAVCIFAISILIYSHNLKFLWSSVSESNSLIFGADTGLTVDAMRNEGYWGIMIKHTLFSITSSSLVTIIQKTLYLDQSTSIRFVLAFIAALNIAGVFLLLKRCNFSNHIALVFTGFYASFFSIIVIFSIPETYSISNLIILVYLFVLIKVRNLLDWKNSLGLSFIAGFGSLYNPPLLTLVIIHLILIFHSRIKHWLLVTLMNVTFGVVIFLSVNFIIHGWEFFQFMGDYSRKYMSIFNIIDLKTILSVAVNFIFYSIISPVRYLPANLGLEDLAGYGQSLLGISIFTLTAFFLSYGFFITLIKNQKRKPLAIGLLAWILFMILFYTYFNPQESMLYSSQILLPLLIILANAFEEIRIGAFTKNSAMIILFSLSTINNYLSFYAGIHYE